ncbi:MAG: NAD-dependent epimerase/dehydratase family protein [Candidatus Thorarchaeota archaeon]|nr:NAD-dependent epimerase/dehydratase family protein [Candidatus Thorarchaeota archaeon]
MSTLKRVLVTGGAGFVGSHLVDRLAREYEVVVLDDLSTGLEENLSSHIESDDIVLVRGSILSRDDVQKALDGVSAVYHFAAQPDVRLSAVRPFWDFEINLMGSMVLLEAVREAGIQRFVFASSGGTVYGRATTLPTPESTLLRPVSNYGAAKSAFEMYLSSYSELYGLEAVSVRFGNIIGPRSTHGVIYDFYSRLKSDPRRLEVLGDGTQEKSYVCVHDAVDATVLLGQRAKEGFLPVNVSSGERLRVSRIAELVVDELGLGNTRIEYTGGRAGWQGDVVLTDLDVSLLKSFGWKPQVSLEDCIRMYIRWLRNTLGEVI